MTTILEFQGLGLKIKSWCCHFCFFKSTILFFPVERYWWIVPLIKARVDFERTLSSQSLSDILFSFVIAYLRNLHELFDDISTENVIENNLKEVIIDNR